MKTFEMMKEAEKTGQTYVTEDLRFSIKNGFHNNYGRPWSANAFSELNDVLKLDDWELLDEVKRMTLKEIERKLGYKIELVSEQTKFLIHLDSFREYIVGGDNYSF